ncbi:hypothetical protein KFU94_51935 [Chloroflexi bacterium TSY]|nr:hypothetical protein [Chloroflexi bacterium TSY]
MKIKYTEQRPPKPGWDALLLVLLVFAQLQILAFGEDTIPREMRLNDIARHPILGNIIPTAGEEAMGVPGPRPIDPIGLVLFALTIGGVLGYLIVDLVRTKVWHIRLKWFFLWFILCTTLILPTTKFILLRQQSGPASYTHDGGVIQTEAATSFLLQGKNPYTEDYDETPMAEWGFSRFRTALYHYPYLPWSFIGSVPFYLLGTSFGLYDQRVVYLLLFILALILARQLVDGERHRLALTAMLGLNPIMSLDIVFGQNDSFVLCWIICSLVCWRLWLKTPNTNVMSKKRWLVASTLCFGLACASKPTAWFMAPFYGFLLVADVDSESLRRWSGLIGAIPLLVKRAGPAILIFSILLLPFVIWDPASLYDDVWRWSSGQGETGYQIWGWGASNFVLALGFVTDRFDQWPFYLLEIVIALPLLLWFLSRQQKENTLAAGCWHYGIFLFAFFYASRFLNQNYLGYILAFFAIGFISSLDQTSPECSPSKLRETTMIAEAKERS